MGDWIQEVERVTTAELGDLQALSLDEIRARRDECRRIEDKVSYLRRLVQGRLDIVAADRRRRADGESASPLPELVEQLPGILSDRSPPAGPGRLPSSLAPPDDLAGLTDQLDDVAPAGLLADLAGQADDTVASLAERLAGLEREVSDARRALFGRIDAFQGELARRYKTGEATVASVLEDS